MTAKRTLYLRRRAYDRWLEKNRKAIEQSEMVSLILGSFYEKTMEDYDSLPRRLRDKIKEDGDLS